MKQSTLKKPEYGNLILTILVMFVAILIGWTKSSGSDLSTDVRELKLGAPIERELAGGRSHFYSVSLISGQYMHVVVEQKGIDVVVRLFAPGGRQLLEMDSPNNAHGPEPVSVIAEAAGDYRLEVKALDEKAVAGRYEIKVSELRESQAKDRVRILAERTLAEGEQLHAKGTAESLHRSIEKFKDALPLLRAVEDRWQEAQTLNVIGLVYRLLGEPLKALEFYNQALPLRRAVADRWGEAVTLYNIGAAYSLVSEPQKALEYYHQALLLERAVGDRWGEANTLRNTGAVYKLVGEPQRASEYYADALSLKRIVGDRNGEADMLTNLGVIWSQLGDTQKALNYHIQALSLKRALGDRIGEADTLNNLGAAYWSSGELQKALEYYNQSLMLRRVVVDRREEAVTLSQMGAIYSLLGRPEEGLKYLEQALSLHRVVGDKESEGRTLQRMAGVERQRGRLDEARAKVEASLGIMESIRSKLISQELRTSLLAFNHSLHEFYIDLLMQMHRRQPSSGYDTMALEASERARGRSLLEMLTEAGADIRQGVDPGLLERERSSQRELSARAERLTRLVSGKHSEEQEKAARREVETLVTDYQDVEAQIREKSPRYAALTQPHPLSLKEIQQQLDQDTLLLEYALGEERSYLWAVTPTSIASFELPKRAEIESAARRLDNLFVTKADALYPAVLFELSQTLLGPVANQLGRKRLLIVGQGALEYVPFGALPEPTLSRKPSTTGRHATTNKYRQLILEHEVISLPSASVIAVLRRERSMRKIVPKKVAVLADPVFDKDDQRVKSRTKNERNQANKEKEIGSNSDVERSASDLGLINFDRLPVSRREAELITALVPKGKSLKVLDFDASLKTAMSPTLAQYQIVHFATHSFLNNQHPELSGVVLSLVDERGQPQDGFLRLHEIYNLKLNADLVVLSSCETALGKEIKGEGLVGLTRGFMYAGAPRVVASLWKVSDSATAELMKRFYQNMLDGWLRPAAALRAAQISLLKEKHWAAPYYWAGFVFQGEWR